MSQPPASSAAPGVPWILGHRGAPLEAPENTLSSLRRALELGLDGVEYDLRRAAGGEAVLLHDATLERTTDLDGPVAGRSLVELARADAGGWFARAFRGEPLPLFEEALELARDPGSAAAWHMIEIKDPGLVRPVVEALRAARAAALPSAGALAVRVAAFERETCVEVQEAGFPAMLLAVDPSEDDREFIRRNAIAAYGLGPRGWSSPAAAREWPCERWAWSVDEPDDLLAALRAPLYGLNTNEGLRALAARELLRLAPAFDSPWPVRAQDLFVEPQAGKLGRAEWSGRWSVAAEVENPLPFPVRARVALAVRHGAFEAQGLPASLELGPRERADLRFRLTGGSWSPGGDPCLAVRYSWRAARGRAAGKLSLDAPLHRVRSCLPRAERLRLPLLAERPGDPEASVLVQRHGRELLVSLERDGGLEQPGVIVHLAGQTRRGARGLRLRLPKDFDERRDGVPFSVGIEGRDPRVARGVKRTRRWAGGLPDELGQGVPGVLRSRPEA